jgi:hypothetical protein
MAPPTGTKWLFDQALRPGVGPQIFWDLLLIRDYLSQCLRTGDVAIRLRNWRAVSSELIEEQMVSVPWTSAERRIPISIAETRS